MATQVVTDSQLLELQPIKVAVHPSGNPSATSEEPPNSLTDVYGPPAETQATGSNTAVAHSKLRASLLVTQLLGLNLFSSFCNGIIVVGLPTMAANLGIEEGLLVWPTSVFYLTAGACLLLAGSIADVVGTKRMNLTGAFLAAVSAMACGLAQTGGQLIAFRAVQGITNAIIVPSSVSIVSTSMKEGRLRNLGFACLGFAGPIGFSLGLVLGGVLVGTTGWRPAFYLAAAVAFALFLLGIWALPQDAAARPWHPLWSAIVSEIDITGACIGTASLAMLSYVLA